MSYLPCELHCHTTNSNGDLNIKDLQNKTLSDHLALIAITDCNKNAGYDDIDNSIIPVVKGTEYSTKNGDIIILGNEQNADLSNIIQVKHSGSVIGIVHPTQYGTVNLASLVDYMEIWHGGFSFDNKENDKSLQAWTDLLDKGYHIAATYGRDWQSVGNDNHCGCTYIDIDGDINCANALNAIKKGATVVSTGAKMFFRVYQNGTTYNIGDTAKKGMSVFSFFTDLHARQKDAGSEEIKYTTIKVVSNGGECVAQTDITQRHIQINLKRNKWYRAELWGTVDGVEKPLAITSAVYTA